MDSQTATITHYPPHMGWNITPDDLGLFTISKGDKTYGPFPNLTRTLDAIAFAERAQ